MSLLRSLLSGRDSAERIPQCKIANPKSRFRFPRLERLENRLALSGFGPEDGSYILESWEGSYSDIEIQPGTQAMVAIGGMGRYTPTTTALRRYDFDANADLSYGNSGIASIGPIGATISALAFQPDGKVVVAGQQPLTSGYDIGVGRLTAGGLPDTSFSGDGWATISTAAGTASELAAGVAIQSDGDIVVAGASSWTSAVVASFKSTGAVDSGKGGFGQSLLGRATGYAVNKLGAVIARFDGGVAIQPDNKIVAAGYVSTDGLNQKLLLARFTSSGRLDTTFNGKGYTTLTSPVGFSNSQALGVKLQADGKIVVAGNAEGMDGAGDVFVARYKTNGTLDTTFAGLGYTRFDIDGASTVTNEAAFDLEIQTDGKIVVAGREFLQSDTATQNILVARFNPNGTPDTSFGNGGHKLGMAPVDHVFYGSALVLQPDGDIIVAGSYSDHTVTHPLLMRFSGAGNIPAAQSAESAAATDAALFQFLTEEQPSAKRRR
jgi:uncharacterized delta-60 repeat protein